MSPLMRATLDWLEALHLETGHDPRRIVLPKRAYDALRSELDGEATVTDGDPISGVGANGRVWLATTELVADTE